MARIAVLGCKRIQDSLCVACAKCLKAMSLREGEFARYGKDDLELVAMGDCGDCPGLIMPKITLINEIVSSIDREYDTIHLGTCVVKAKMTGACPLDFEKLSSLVKQNFKMDLVVGTHPY